MREIKFRGRRLDNGEWGYGYLVVDRGTYISDHATALYINIDGWRAVDPKTVGQYTCVKTAARSWQKKYWRAWRASRE